MDIKPIKTDADYRFEMERKGLTVKDLEPMIGRSNRVYEILNHKRTLTLKMKPKQKKVLRNYLSYLRMAVLT